MRRRVPLERPPVPAWVVESDDSEAAELWATVNGYDYASDEILGARLSVPKLSPPTREQS